MLKSEVQHQFWVTKKVVERKLGTKEDECVVSSDAELDAKIELFKSISESCSRLHRIIDQYQERLCILAQEENALGKFLKETGKNSNTSGKAMICAGKAISYCGQQRMTLRPSLLRLFHEVETFRCRAIADTHATIMTMEKERTEYRAALSWMKSASAQLDPDTGRGVEKFRKAQNHVRLSKAKFDRLTLDCLQKIDLLAAARCNMFSHALVAYMAALLQFAVKSSETFKATAQALSTNPQYNFCVLKDLADSIQVETETPPVKNIDPIDSDQMLFFLDDYKDEKKKEQHKNQSLNNTQNQQIKNDDNSDVLIEVSSEDKDIIQQTTDMFNNLLKSDNNLEQKDKTNKENKEKTNLLNLSNYEIDDFTAEGSKTPAFMPSQLLNEISVGTNNAAIFEPRIDQKISVNANNEVSKLESTKSKNSILDFFNRPNNSNKNSNTKDENINSNSNSSNLNQTISKSIKLTTSKKDMSSWFELFAELDPLSNPDALAKQIDGGKENSQAA